MKIKMLVHIAGPGLAAGAGEEIDRPDSEALRLIQKGYAAAAEVRPAVETAVPAPVVETRAETPAPQPEPFGGKGDHDGDGKPGGAKKPARKAPRKRR